MSQEGRAVLSLGRVRSVRSPECRCLAGRGCSCTGRRAWAGVCGPCRTSPQAPSSASEWAPGPSAVASAPGRTPWRGLRLRACVPLAWPPALPDSRVPVPGPARLSAAPGSAGGPPGGWGSRVIVLRGLRPHRGTPPPLVPTGTSASSSPTPRPTSGRRTPTSSTWTTR